MSINLDEIAEELSWLTPRERLEWLVDLGQQWAGSPLESLSHLDPVPGCASTAYIRAHASEGIVQIDGNADSLVVRGLIALLAGALADRPVKGFCEQARTDLDVFLARTGLAQGLVASRANAIGSLLQAVCDDVSPRS